MNKFKFAFIITFTITILAFTNLCGYAATSDTIYDNSLAQSLISQYGSDYEAPHVVSSGAVDLESGVVRMGETDLSLPGKNGMNLNIVRKHYENGAPGNFTYSSGIGINGFQNHRPIYKYNYTYGGVQKSIHVLFNTEEDIKDDFYTTNAKLTAGTITQPIENGVNYIIYNNLVTTSGIKLTRDKDAETLYEILKGAERYSYDIADYSVKLGDEEAKSSWYITMPHIKHVWTKNVSNIKTLNYSFTDESGKVIDLYYEVIYENNKPVLDESSIEFKGENNYTAKIYSTPQTLSVESGVQIDNNKYILSICDEYGKTYYFAENLSGNPTGLPIAVTDKNNNAIYYKLITEKTENSKQTKNTIEIIDTYKRKINITSSGITVSNADSTETKSVSYVAYRENDNERDPNGKLNIFSKYILSVKKYNGQTYETTDYISHKNTIDIGSTGQVMYSDKIEEVKYPTNASVNYEYQTHKDYVIKRDLPSTRGGGDSYKDFPIAKETQYEDGVVKNEKTYDYTFYTASTCDKVKKRVKIKEKLDSSTTKETECKFDALGRMTENKVGNILKYTNEEYIYKSNSDKLLAEISSNFMSSLRSSPIATTKKYDMRNLYEIQYAEYNKKVQPTRQIKGELETTSEYDDKYGVLTYQNAKKDANTKLEYKSTLTSDGKNIESTNVYENNRLKFTTSYTYNSDGTVSSESRMVAGEESIISRYSYSYNSNGSYSITIETPDIKDADGNISTVSVIQNYDWLGNLISMIDANGNITRFEYDLRGRQTKQINADGTFITASYNISDNSVTVTDENGNSTTQDYSPLGNMDKIYLDNNPSELVASYEYDNGNRLLSETAYQDVNGTAISQNYTYDTFNRITTMTSKQDNTVLENTSYEYEYKDGYKVPESINPDIDVSNVSKIVVLVQNLMYYNNPTKLSSGSKEYVSENIGQFASRYYVVDVSTVSTISIYTKYNSNVTYMLITDEESANNVTMLGGASQTIRATYTGDSTYVNPTVEMYVDGFGNKVSESYYKKGTSTLLNKNIYKYDYAGNVIETLGGRTYMENLGDYTSKAEYNYMNQPTKAYQADGTYATTTYDGYGNAIASADFMGNITTVAYDKLGRAISCDAPFEGAVTTNSLTYYDKNGNVIVTKQQNNKVGEATNYAVTEHEYDNRNRLVTVKVNDGSRDIYTQYAYDKVGNVIKMVTGQTSKISDLYGTMPDGVTYQTYEYDRFGNVTKATDALGQDVISEYNLMGLPTKQTDKNGNTMINTYNAYGSVLTSKVSGGGESTIWESSEDITNTYSKNNMLISAKQGSSTTAYTYDDYGNVKTEISDGITNEYTYDVDGNRKSHSQKKGNKSILFADLEYDNLNRLIDIDYMDVYASYKYDANGRLVSESSGIVKSTYTYNSAGMLINLDNSSGYSYKYTYRLDGNQITKFFRGENSYGTYNDYSYNDIGQLVNENFMYDDGGTGTIFYKYDSKNNRISKRGNGGQNQYEYDINNRLLKETNVLGQEETQTSYEYDNNGNMLFKGIEKYAQQSNLSEDIIISEAGKSENDDKIDYATYYTYNTRNQMTKAQSDSMDASYSYDAVGRRISKTVNGQTTKHAWDGSNITVDIGKDRIPYFRGINLIGQRGVDGETYYYVHNGHGDVANITDSNGNVVSSYDYDTFGNELENWLSEERMISTPFRYNGQYTDDETGLIYLRNRYYDPEAGRFTQEDPARDGLNWYAYCGNNPIMFVDPFGLDHYIYYTKDQKDAAEAYEKQLLEDDPDTPVHMIYVDTADTFYENWDNMGVVDGETVSIDTVIINVHGNPYQMFSENHEMLELDSLDYKEMDTLVLLSCNAGNMDYDYLHPEGENIAAQYARRQGAQRVIAPDGTNYRHYNNNGFVGLSSKYEGKNRGNEQNPILEGNGSLVGGNGYVVYEMYRGTLYITAGISEDGEIVNSINTIIDKGKKVSIRNKSLSGPSIMRWNWGNGR